AIQEIVTAQASSAGAVSGGRKRAAKNLTEEGNTQIQRGAQWSFSKPPEALRAIGSIAPARNQQHYFAFWRMCLVMSKKLCCGPAPKFFELLRKFAGDAQLSILQDLDRYLQRFRQAIWRFEKDRCLGASTGCVQLALAPAAFRRKKTAKEELRGREAR